MNELNGKNIDVVGIGVSTLDMFTAVDAFPTTREVQKAAGMVLDGGGPVATAIVTLAKLGAKTVMIDNLGDDWVGSLIVDDFTRHRVNTEWLERFPQHTSSVANILVQKATGSRAIIYHPGSAPEIKDIAKYTPVIQAAKLLHLNGRHLEACLQAVDIAKKAGVKVSFDGGANRYHPGLRDLVPKVDICIVAKDFACKYTDETAPEQAARKLKAAGPELVAITDGVKGSWVLQGDTLEHQHAFLVSNVVDTTGCGDSYHGAFLYGLLRKMTWKQAAEFASAVASLNTQTLGGRKGLPSLNKVAEFLADRHS